MRKIAVFGSRNGIEPLDVGNEIARLMGEHGMFIVVTTEASGACEAATTAALTAGLPVVSFRTVKLRGGREIPDDYGVDEWRLYKGQGEIIHHHRPIWAAWEGAAIFRSMLMIERADEGRAFWNGYSPGTQIEIGFFEDAEKQCEVLR